MRPLAAVRPRPCREWLLACPPGRGLPVRAGSGAVWEQQRGGVLGDVHDLPVVAGDHPGHDPVSQRIENEARQ